MSSTAATALDSPLARRNPTIKFALLFIASIALVFVFDPLTPAVLYLLALAAVLATARIRSRVLALAHVPFVGFAIGLIVVNALSRPGEPLFDWGPRITAEGLTVGLALALRTMVIGILSIAFIASTDGVSLMTSLHQHARLGARVTYAVLAGYRLLQELPAEWQTIRQAQAVRAPLSKRTGRPASGVRAFGRAAFSLLVVSLRRSERMAQALESRGLGLQPRTTWRPVALNRTDWMFAACVLLVLAAVFVATALVG
jgi:energy-coupling factor transport system permease protein